MGSPSVNRCFQEDGNVAFMQTKIKRPTCRVQRNRKYDLGNDDAGFFTLELKRLRELTPKKLDETARAGTSVGAQQTHPIEESQQIEDFCVLERGGRAAFRLLFLDFAEERD